MIDNTENMRFFFMSKKLKIFIVAMILFVLNHNELIAFIGFVDIEGNIIIQPHFNKVSLFSNGLSLVEKNGQYHYIDLDGKLVFGDNCVTGITGFSNGTAVVKNKNNILSFIDLRGHLICQLNNSWVSGYPFSDGLAAVALLSGGEEVWGFVNKKGNVVIKPKYNAVFSFSEKYAAVKTNNKWGFMSLRGKLTIPCIYDSVQSFSGGVAIVERINQKNDKEIFAIDPTGKIVINFNEPFNWHQDSFFKAGDIKQEFIDILRQKNNNITNHIFSKLSKSVKKRILNNTIKATDAFFIDAMNKIITSSDFFTPDVFVLQDLSSEVRYILENFSTCYIPRLNYLLLTESYPALIKEKYYRYYNVFKVLSYSEGWFCVFVKKIYFTTGIIVGNSDMHKSTTVIYMNKNRDVIMNFPDIEYPFGDSLNDEKMFQDLFLPIRNLSMNIYKPYNGYVYGISSIKTDGRQYRYDLIKKEIIWLDRVFKDGNLQKHVINLGVENMYPCYFVNNGSHK